MSLAEKKLQLLQWVMSADEEMTGKLTDFAASLQKPYHPSAEAVQFYEKRSEEMRTASEKSFSKEESLQSLRNLIK